MISVEVALEHRSYPVIVGRGARSELASVLPAGAQRAAIVTQAGIGVPVETGLTQQVDEIGDGEESKTLATVEGLCRAWSVGGLTRGDVVVAVGGGLVTDVTGFAAAMYHRGVPVVHVATTLLGMVDAAIGGKTGVNLPEGKNLIGAFWQPLAVICELDALDTLSPRELRSGHGEMAKYHFLTEQDLDSLPLDQRVAACVTIKADVVAADEREDLTNRQGRAVLNYGHTLAHALETSGRYGIRHGEAVAVGLIYAAHLARRLGRIDDDRVEDHYRVVRAYELPEALPTGSDPAELTELMGRDKKARAGLTFVLDGEAGVEVVSDVDPSIVAQVLREMREMAP